MMNVTKLGLGVAAALIGSVLLTGCNDANDPGTEFAPQMYDSLPLEPLKQMADNKHPYNPLGIHERVPPQGAIPRGKLAYFTHIAPDDLAAAETRLVNPYKATPQNLEEGKVLYGRYCQHCHGENGDGNGPVGAKFKGVPNYSAGAYKTMNSGHIYHVIQFGRGRMMPHGSQVNPEERWKIVLWVHKLQGGAEAAADSSAASQESTTAAGTGAGTTAEPANADQEQATPPGTAGTGTAPAQAPAATTAPAPAPAAPADTRTPAQRATDKTRQTHVF